MDTWSLFVAICALILLLLMTISVLLLYSGLFYNVQVGAGKPPIGKVLIAYKFARGPYSEVGPLFFEVAGIAPDNRALGIYYDDPQKVKPHRLRHAVASILAEDEQEADKEMVKKFEDRGFKIMELPAVDNAVYSSFPYESGVCVILGQKKVFNKMAEFILEHKLQAHPILEIYVGHIIDFMAPLDQQQKFYVPEALQQFPGEEPYESVSPVASSPDRSEGSTQPASNDTDKLEEPSLLRPSQVARAGVIGEVVSEKTETTKALGKEAEQFKKTETIGGIESEVETTTTAAEGDESKKAENSADKAESEEDDAEPESKAATEEVKDEQDCGKESSSSFEELDFENEEMSGAQSLSKSK